MNSSFVGSLVPSKGLKDALVVWFSQITQNTPSKPEDMFSGKAIYELLSLIDEASFEKSVIESSPAEIFQEMLKGLKNHFQSKLFTNMPMIPTQPREMVENKDFNQLFALMEVVMCVVLNCEDKEYYIGKIMEMSETHQEQIQPLFEKGMQILSLDMSDAQSMVTDNTTKLEYKMLQDKFDREKALTRHRIEELEKEVEGF